VLDLANFAVVSRPGNAAGHLRGRLPALAGRMVDATAALRAPDRPAIIVIDAPTPDVSSTAVRRRVAEGETVAGMVPPGVLQHIEQHGLYRSDS